MFEILSVFWPLSVPVVLVILAGAHYRSRRHVVRDDHFIDRLLKVHGAFTLAVIVMMAGLMTVRMAKNVVEPPEWDFGTYWVWGKTSAMSLNPYESAHLRHTAQPLAPSDEFLAELYYLYTPPTLFLFTPLGWFDIHAAQALWSVFHTLVLAADIVLLWRLFLRESGTQGLAITAVCMLLLRATTEIIQLSQVNFLLLLFLLLYWNSRDWAGGTAGALAMLLKPVLAVLLLYDLLQGNFRRLLSTVMTTLAASGLTIAVFGWDWFASYFTRNPILHDMPARLYTEPVNQSLLATILRWTGADPTQGVVLLNSIYVAVSIVLIAVTALAIWRRRQAGVCQLERQNESSRNPVDEVSLAILLSLALLVFPKTLSHYATLLVPLLLLMWSRRDRFPGGVYACMLTIAGVYVCVNLRQAFFGFLLTWLAWVGGCLLPHGFAAPEYETPAPSPTPPR